jgi:hypothetical protein
MVKTCCQTETAVVLRKCLFLVPAITLVYFAMKRYVQRVVPVLRYDGILQNLLLGWSILALLRDGRLILLLLEFATHSR